MSMTDPSIVSIYYLLISLASVDADKLNDIKYKSGMLIVIEINANEALLHFHFLPKKNLQTSTLN
jgi:hypothetical protein